MGCPRLDGEIYVEIYFPDVPPRNVDFGDFLAILGEGSGLAKRGTWLCPIFINEMCLFVSENFRSS